MVLVDYFIFDRVINILAIKNALHQHVLTLLQLIDFEYFLASKQMEFSFFGIRVSVKHVDENVFVFYVLSYEDEEVACTVRANEILFKI